MSNRELPMMPWYPDQFQASTVAMTYQERVTYRALLDVQWQLGTLPDDVNRLAHAVGCTDEEMQKVWVIVSKKFRKTRTGLQNYRLEQHRLTALKHKEGKRLGADKTNVLLGRSASSERIAKRHGQRVAERVVSVSPPSPSPSPSPSPTLIHKPLRSSPPSQDLISPPPIKPQRERGDPRRVIKKLAKAKTVGGGAVNGTAAEHDEVADKVRALAQAGNKTGEIVRLLQQNHVTAELVHKLCPELDP